MNREEEPNCHARFRIKSFSGREEVDHDKLFHPAAIVFCLFTQGLLQKQKELEMDLNPLLKPRANIELQ